LKITILQGAFLPVPPTLGGAVEKIWFALGKDFAARGHEVVHISRSYPDRAPEEVIEGVVHKRVHGFDTPSSGIYLKWLDLRYTLRALSSIPRDSDIIITNTFWSPIMISSKLRRKCMVDVQRMPKGQMRFYRKSILRANSTPVAEAIKSEIDGGQHKRVVMIPNPLPFLSSQPVGQAGKSPIVMYAGRVHPEKGIEILISAFKALRSGWKLLIVGPSDVKAGGGGAQYLESLEKLASDDQIEFTGPIYDMDTLSRYYSQASIFVYPSVAEKGETFGLAPLEAMAWGCVPVVSNLACFRDFISHGSNGLIFDHRDRGRIELLGGLIDSLIKNDTKRSRLAEKALDVRQSHSTHFIATQFLEEFNRMIVEK